MTNTNVKTVTYTRATFINSDITVRRANKDYSCEHRAPMGNGGQELRVPCAGPITKGSYYARTRLAHFDDVAVNLFCQQAAGYVA